MAENKYLKAMQQATDHVKHAEPPPMADAKPEHVRATRTVGRPPGKRSNPDWEQVTLFVRKDTRRAALQRLMDEQSSRDLSEIVEQLLAKWSKIS